MLPKALCLCSLIVLLFAPRSTWAKPSADAQARLHYLAAQTAYQLKVYARTLKELEQAISLLGKTNIRLQSLLVLTLDRLHQPARTLAAAKVFLALGPRPDWEVTAQIVRIKLRLEGALAREESSFRSAKASGHAAAMAGFLRPVQDFQRGLKELHARVCCPALRSSRLDQAFQATLLKALGKFGESYCKAHRGDALCKPRAPTGGVRD